VICPARGSITVRALVLFACESLHMTRAQFYSLDGDEQTEWLAHARNRILGRYEAPLKR
jgi:hypothetical protein